MLQPLTRLVEPLLGLAWRSPCPLCHRPAAPLLCLDCQRQLQECRWSPAEPGQRSTTALTPQPLPLVSLGHYDGMLKRAIAQLKYQPEPRLALPLGAALAEAWQDCSLSRQFWPVVVPVPLHASKLRQRGFNQAAAIAESFCRHSGLPLLRQGLLRCQETQPQFELSPAARQKNVAQAFGLGPDLRPGDRRLVLLMDDIYTTGATVAAIAHCLAQQRIQLVGVAVVAQA